MTPSRNAVLISLLGTAAIAVGASVIKGTLPTGRRMFAIGAVYVGLAAVADTVPRVATPLAGLVFVAVALSEGIDAAKAVGGVSTGKGPLVDGRPPKDSDNTDSSGVGLSLFTKGGGPSDHKARALGNWQSDNAYDLMGSAGQPVYLPFSGTVTNISGQSGGSPQFAGYGVTINNSVFFKHLGTLGPQVKVGARLPAGTLLGTLESSTQGGPHLHLGAKSSSVLDQLVELFT